MRIRHLQLHTPVIEQQYHFYTQVLSIPCLAKKEDRFTLQAGDSLLTFIYSPQPAYYHFAFNIPSFQSQEALTWLQERVAILQDKNQNIIDFINWNAKAIYFFDPAKNIVEFIARKNLGIQSKPPFSSHSIVNLSEIGIPVTQVKPTFQLLEAKTSVRHYWGNFKNFCAAGDENGLFIIVDQNDKQWYPTQIPALPFPLELSVENEQKTYHLSYDGNNLNIR